MEKAMTISQALIKICRFNQGVAEAYEDLGRFNAPSECGALIGKRIEAEEEELRRELDAAGWTEEARRDILHKVGMDPETAYYMFTL